MKLFCPNWLWPFRKKATDYKPVYVRIDAAQFDEHDKSIGYCATLMLVSSNVMRADLIALTRRDLLEMQSQCREVLLKTQHLT